MEKEALIDKDLEFTEINQIYDECINYLKSLKEHRKEVESKINISDSDVKSANNNEPDSVTTEKEPGYATIEEANNTAEKPVYKNDIFEARNEEIELPKIEFLVENEETLKKPEQTKKSIKSNKNDIFEAKKEGVELPKIGFLVENEVSYGNTHLLPTEPKSERLRRLSEQLPRIVITQGSNCSLNRSVDDKDDRRDSKQTNGLRRPSFGYFEINKENKKPAQVKNIRHQLPQRSRTFGDHPKRLVSKTGLESVALISNVPYEKIRLLNDAFHTLINLRWRWIVIGTVVVHFTIWLVFAAFWYIAALAHYDFEPDPPKRSCVTGGKDFVTIFLASVEAQTTIGFGDRAIDEECPEAIFLFIMQLILGTGLSGVLTCVVYAKLTRPEKLSRDGVGFSKNAVISIRDGHLCLMMRAWDLNYDHIISSEFRAHFINTYKTKEGESIKFFARSLLLQQRQFLLWPVVLVHVIDAASPLYKYTAASIANTTFEITVSLKGASASMGTFTQSQTSYTPHEILWGHRFPPVVKYDHRKQKYVIDHKKLNATEQIATPECCAHDLCHSTKPNEKEELQPRPDTPSSFSEKISGFVLERTSSFRRKETNGK